MLKPKEIFQGTMLDATWVMKQAHIAGAAAEATREREAAGPMLVTPPPFWGMVVSNPDMGLEKPWCVEGLDRRV